MIHKTARETLPETTRAILASGGSVDLIQFRKYVFHVFAGDWLHNAMRPENRGLTEPEIARRVAAGTLVSPGEHAGDFDAPDQKLCRRFIEHFGPVSLADIGANYGHEGMRYALLACAIGQPVVRHACIEPGFAGLVLPANMVLHGLGEARIVSAALAGEESMALLHFSHDTTTGGTLTDNPRSTRSKKVPVRLATWDRLAEELGFSGPTFFKIDIQGAERYFLDCASGYLAANPCAGICEFLPPDFGSPKAAAEFLQRFSAEYHLIDAGMRRDRTIPVADAFDDHVARIMALEKPWTDLLFFPRSLGADFLG